MFFLVFANNQALNLPEWSNVFLLQYIELNLQWYFDSVKAIMNLIDS